LTASVAQYFLLSQVDGGAKNSSPHRVPLSIAQINYAAQDLLCETVRVICHRCAMKNSKNCPRSEEKNPDLSVARCCKTFYFFHKNREEVTERDFRLKNS